jgi:hypothetical protein
MNDEEIRGRIIRLGFKGDRKRFEEFCDRLRSELPEGTGIALRGSVVTNERWSDGEPFDSSGEGTSDLDVTLIGEKAMEYWDKEQFYIPGLHTKPLSDKDPGIAPGLNSLRESLQQLARRPVNFQATSNLVLFVRDVLFDQPYFTLIEPGEKS